MKQHKSAERGLFIKNKKIKRNVYNGLWNHPPNLVQISSRNLQTLLKYHGRRQGLRIRANSELLPVHISVKKLF